MSNKAQLTMNCGIRLDDGQATEINGANGCKEFEGSQQESKKYEKEGEAKANQANQATEVTWNQTRRLERPQVTAICVGP